MSPGLARCRLARRLFQQFRRRRYKFAIYVGLSVPPRVFCCLISFQTAGLAPNSQPTHRAANPVLPASLSDADVVARCNNAQYRIAVERLFWYARQSVTPVSAWTLEAFSAYITFLQAPAPRAIRVHNVHFDSARLTPFPRAAA